MARYLKPHRTYTEQVAILESRGLKISDPASAAATLSHIGYYRLSGYSYPYRRPGKPRRDDFELGTTWEQIISLYNFDRKLKLHMLDAIERIEIAMRVRVGYVLGQRNSFAHKNPAHLDPRFSRAKPGRSESEYQKWSRLTSDAFAYSNEEFASHFKKFYDGNAPIWVLTEVMDFGSLSRLYAGSKRSDRDRIAAELEILDASKRGNGKVLANWLRVLGHVRNVCAHHARLWNRNMTVQVAPSHLKHIPELAHLQQPGAMHSRVYSTMCIVAFLTKQIAPNSDVVKKLFMHLKDGLHSSGRSTSEMGAPDDWQRQPVWVES